MGWWDVTKRYNVIFFYIKDCRSMRIFKIRRDLVSNFRAAQNIHRFRLKYTTPNCSGTHSYLNIRVCFTICICLTECLSENDFQNRFSPIDRSKWTWNPIFFLPSKIRRILPKRYYERNKYYLLFCAHFLPVKHRNKCIHIISYTVYTCNMHHAYYTGWFEFYEIKAFQK